MRKPRFLICLALPCLMATLCAMAVAAGNRVVIFDGITTEVTPPPANLPGTDSGDLWVTLKDLTRATKFVLKPQGVCRDQLCFPIPRGRRAAFLNRQGKVTWFNLSEFARLVRQPAAYDIEATVWYFGPRADEQNGYVESLVAPNFTLPDMNGKRHSLSDFRGKKVLLLTWASW
jgi:hypothetical protein